MTNLIWALMSRNEDDETAVRGFLLPAGILRALSLCPNSSSPPKSERGGIGSVEAVGGALARWSLSSFSRLTRSELASSRVRLLEYFTIDWPTTYLPPNRPTGRLTALSSHNFSAEQSNSSCPAGANAEHVIKRLCTARPGSFKSTERPLRDGTPISRFGGPTSCRLHSSARRL